jgi:histidinol-phosphate aminotransferase
VEELIEKVGGRALIVLDEAYVQFADAPDYPNGIEYVKQGKMLVALRTFSKIVGLAGLRCGYGVMHPTLAKVLESLRIKFSVNSLAQAAALAAVKDKDHMEKSRRMIIEGRKYFYEHLDKIGLKYAKTQGNFIWIDFGQNSKEITKTLLHEGVIVRPGFVFDVPTHARVSISNEHDNAFFFEKLKKALSVSVGKT